MPTLLEPFHLGPTRLRNRLVLAPLTRSRALPGGFPSELMREYYVQRSGAGLMVSEGIVVSEQGASYPDVPGLFDDAHATAWRDITEAVHAEGGMLFAQLWHVGRQSHSSVQPDGETPLAPSAVPITGYSYYAKPDKLPYETPRAMTQELIDQVVGEYARAARRAMAAGFDGVEIHAANGYLIDQFLNSSSNRRDDAYGGSPAARARFLHEVIAAVTTAVPADRVGVRLSPSSTWMDVTDPDKAGLFEDTVASLAGHGLAYLHLVEPDIAGAVTVEHDDAATTVPTARLRELFGGVVISTGGHDVASAEAALSTGGADLVGFGRPFIANPDLPRRIAVGAEWNEPDRRTFYTGGARGYTDYPSLGASQPVH